MKSLLEVPLKLRQNFKENINHNNYMKNQSCHKSVTNQHGKSKWIISQCIMEWDTTSGTQTLAKGDTASVVNHLCFSEAELGPFQPLTLVSKSSISVGAGVLASLTPKIRVS